MTTAFLKAIMEVYGKTVTGPGPKITPMVCIKPNVPLLSLFSPLINNKPNQLISTRATVLSKRYF